MGDSGGWIAKLLACYAGRAIVVERQTTAEHCTLYQRVKSVSVRLLEQTASGLFPSLYTNAAQLQALGIKGDSDEKRRASVDIGISRLLQMQRDNGGFALWIKTVTKSTG